MKRLLFIVAISLCQIAQAQIVSSTYIQVKNPKEQYVKGGLALSVDGNIGYDICYGFQKPSESGNIYWGMEMGLGTRGSDEVHCHTIKIAPIFVGKKLPSNKGVVCVPQLGTFISCDFIQDCYGATWCLFKNNDNNHSPGTTYHAGRFFDFGVTASLCFWIQRVGIEFGYQQGVLDDGGKSSITSDYYGSSYQPFKFNCTSNFLFRIAYRFK